MCSSRFISGEADSRVFAEGEGVDPTHLYTPVEALTHASGSRYFSLCAMLQNIFNFFLFIFLSFSRFL